MAVCFLWLLSAVGVHAQVAVSDFEAGNVSTRQFDVVWRVSDPGFTPGIHVYSDAAGTTPITADLKIEFFPVKAGNPEVTGNGDMAERQAAQSAIASQSLVWVRVSGLEPDTTYYVAPDSLDNGSSNLSGDPGLLEVTTPASVGFVSELRQVQVAFSSYNPAEVDGVLVRLQAADGGSPLFAALGDGAPDDAAYFNLAHLLDAAGMTNRDPAAPLDLNLSLLGADAPGGAQGLTVAFDGTYTVAAAQMVAFEGTVGNVASFVFDPIDDQREHVPFVVSITAVDENGARVTDFTGTVELTGTATFEQGGGETEAFSNGELLVHTVELSGEGEQTLTASNSGGAVTGTSDPFQLLPADTYADWQQDAFGSQSGDPNVSGMGQDPDGDGLSNLLEFAYGLDPLASDMGGRGLSGEADQLADEVVFSYHRRKDRLGITYTVQQATNPRGPWTTVTPEESTQTVTDVDENRERVDVHVAAPSSGQRLFMRLRVATE
ncbi:MAG: Pectinesterase [Puniceicoccaceae bacterium 5H]|nr:MAG: Pectinesterase [Puniceicoccaceae bacterium 5H]